MSAALRRYRSTSGGVRRSAVAGRRASSASLALVIVLRLSRCVFGLC